MLHQRRLLVVIFIAWSCGDYKVVLSLIISAAEVEVMPLSRFSDIPRGSIYTTIMELGSQNHNRYGLLGPNSIMAVYMDPLGLSSFRSSDTRRCLWI